MQNKKCGNSQCFAMYAIMNANGGILLKYYGENWSVLSVLLNAWKPARTLHIADDTLRLVSFSDFPMIKYRHFKNAKSAITSL